MSKRGEKPNLQEALGAALRHLRETRQRKQYRVAEEAGITKGMLSSYEKGRQLPRLTTLYRILEELDSSLEELGRLLRRSNR